MEGEGLAVGGLRLALALFEQNGAGVGGDPLGEEGRNGERPVMGA